ncbi:MAG: Nre family DNA repair protein [Promethearchaeota archaeon]
MVRPNTPAGLCLKCKGSRHLCGKEPCPILVKYSILKSSKFSAEVIDGLKQGHINSRSPPSFFVGHQGYPAVRVGPMLPHDLDSPLDIHHFDSPESWVVPGESPSTWKEIQDIVKFRSSLVRTVEVVNVKKWKDDKLLKLGQEIAMAKEPVATEVSLDKIHLKVDISDHSPPTGPIGQLKELEITENPKVHKKVDYVVSDGDLKASDAVFKYLYSDARLPVSDIQRILSAGLIGDQAKRKLVPTRWAITAVDDTVSKKMVTRIKSFPELGEFLVHESSFAGNVFFIMMIPGRWRGYEMMESWSPHSIWRVLDIQKKYVIVSDTEFENGRKSYASNVTGAYYAARLAITEHLTRIKRQATPIVIREVNENYLIPLGVWVIRQTARDALSRPPRKFSSIEHIFRYLKTRLQIPPKFWIRKSALLKELRQQKTLIDFSKQIQKKP